MPSRWINRRTLALTGVGLLVAVALYGLWIGWARPSPDPEAEAVIVHAGQRQRLRHAERLMAEGAAPTLVVFFAPEVYPGEVDDLCRMQETYDVICVDPALSSTLGEAREIDALAREQGWESVIIVTSNYHLRRARYLDRKCSDIEILGVAVRSRNFSSRMSGVIREMAAMPVAVVSSCR